MSTQMKDASPKPEEKRTAACQLPEDIVKMLRVISAHSGSAQGDIAAPFLRPGITKLYRKAINEMRDLGEAGA